MPFSSLREGARRRRDGSITMSSLLTRLLLRECPCSAMDECLHSSSNRKISSPCSPSARRDQTSSNNNNNTNSNNIINTSCHDPIPSTNATGPSPPSDSPTASGAIPWTIASRATPTSRNTPPKTTSTTGAFTPIPRTTMTTTTMITTTMITTTTIPAWATSFARRTTGFRFFRRGYSNAGPPRRPRRWAIAFPRPCTRRTCATCFFFRRRRRRRRRAIRFW
mmetsp:Transcript_16525/g.26742  ORF Transcript_16525/g.26742 Transcript_16525/m.26742 type:complete len:222 (+) Transcript_16525:435-1100(+)